MSESGTCCYCKLQHVRVEDGGVSFCPNVLCTGPGGHRHRRGLASYAEERYPLLGDHTVDEEEWRQAGLAAAETLAATDPALATRIRQDAADFPAILRRRRQRQRERRSQAGWSGNTSKIDIGKHLGEECPNKE